MARRQRQKSKKKPTRQANKYWRFAYRQRHFRVLLDKVLFFRYLRRIQGRFWGVTAMTGMVLGFSVCFAIRPDMIVLSTALSDFASDFRTAPYFAGSVFFAAYGMWRWRTYLAHTWKRRLPGTVTSLITLTIVGLYLVALMPVAWDPVYYIHIFGVALAGASMFATVVIDSLMTSTRKTSNITTWRLLRLLSFVAILVGGWLTFGSADIIAWYDVTLLGESLMLAGYFIWIIVKTYQGQGKRTLLAKFVQDFVKVY